MTEQYDVIVIGTGSMGSATCFELAKRGHRVLGLEQFSSPHQHGAHTGQSRIIRKAYFEHPDYVPLLQRAYEKWNALEQVTREKVFYKTGLAYFGPSSHPVIAGTKQAASLHSLGLEFQINFNQFEIPRSFESLYERDAGFLRPERSIALYCDQAKKAGAVLHNYETVESWTKENGIIHVRTNENNYRSKKLVITAGAWTKKMIGDLVDLNVTRQLIVWVDPVKKEKFLPASFPCWLIADEKRAGALYGFPYLHEKEFGTPNGMKFAWHHPATVTDPDNVNRKIEQQEIDELVSWVAEYIPAVADSKVAAAKTCLYTNSSDENFIIDHLPGFDNDVVIACGFSGHGFKFVSVVGEILADLAMKGKSDLPIAFLSLSRF